MKSSFKRWDNNKMGIFIPVSLVKPLRPRSGFSSLPFLLASPGPCPHDIPVWQSLLLPRIHPSRFASTAVWSHKRTYLHTPYKTQAFVTLYTLSCLPLSRSSIRHADACKASAIARILRLFNGCAKPKTPRRGCPGV